MTLVKSELRFTAADFRKQISRERISFIYFAGLRHVDLDDLLALAA